MEKKFVPYELALELKKLGFFEECLGFYIWQSWNNNSRLEIGNDDEYACETIKAPLWQQAFDWFREKNYMEGHPYISYNLPPKATWGYSIQTSEPKYIKSLNSHYSTYEEARQACLEKLIELAKEQNVK